MSSVSYLWHRIGYLPDCKCSKCMDCYRNEVEENLITFLTDSEGKK